jgi:hypothetical protein
MTMTEQITIECGTTSERRTRLGLITAALLAFGLWFAYDGWVGYPTQNREELLGQLPPDTSREEIPFYPGVTTSLFRELPSPASREDVERAVGGPPSVKSDLDVRWFGPAGQIVVESRDGRPSPAVYRDTRRSETDLRWQRIIAMGLLAAFVIAALRLLPVLTARYRLDGEGLTLARQGLIRWDAIEQLDASRYAEKGWVELVCRDGDERKAVRLDSYEIAALDDMLEEICRRKGFASPRAGVARP